MNTEATIYPDAIDYQSSLAVPDATTRRKEAMWAIPLSTLMPWDANTAELIDLRADGHLRFHRHEYN